MNPDDILKYGHKTILDVIEGFPESEWETGGVCGIWSTKDIISHLASYEGWLAEVLMPFIGISGAMPYMKKLADLGPHGFNDAEVKARKQKTPAAVWTEYNAAYDRIRDMASQVPAEKWPQNGTLPWYGGEYSLDDFIVYTFYGHKREHAAQIAVFRDKFKG